MNNKQKYSAINVYHPVGRIAHTHSNEYINNKILDRAKCPEEHRRKKRGMEHCGRICWHHISVEVIRGHCFEEKIVQMRP